MADTGLPIPKPRLQQLLEAAHNNSSSASIEEMTEKLTHIRTPSLPHLLALLAHPPPNFPPKGTSLLVVDSVSAPFPSYFPNATEIRSRLAPASSGGKEQQQQTQWLLNRKRNVASDLASHAAKLASTRGLAVVLLNQTHTKIRGLPRPTLYPALATGGAWESCIATRIVIYREFFLDISGEKKKKKVRFAEMMKKGGKVLAARTEEDIIRFIIDDVSGFFSFLFSIFAMLMLI
jgi:RecA/RadA recombinase